MEHYEFDLCTIDGSDTDNKTTIDNWRPAEKSSKIIQSEWRKIQIGTNYNQQPGGDDVRKIIGYIKKRYADTEIMRAFGISAETLIAIKSNRYCPIDGIALSDLDKIHNEFNKFKKDIRNLLYAVEYISKSLFIDETELKKYKDYCKKKDKLKLQHKSQRKRRTDEL
jgi:hypothetical protein